MNFYQELKSARREEENVFRDELESIKNEKEQLEELVDVQRTKAKKQEIEVGFFFDNCQFLTTVLICSFL